MADSIIKSLDGQSFGAYIAQPKNSVGVGLLVIQEIFGVNQTMRKICDDFAAEGYVVVCPDLYWRQEPNVQISDQTSDEWPRAFNLYKSFDVEAGVRDLLATLAHMRQMPGCSGRVGAVGYSLGGKMSFLMASRSDIDCSVSYYCLGLEAMLHEVPDIRMPAMVHLAEKDKFVSASDRVRILRAIERNKVIATHSYPNVEHGFARPGGQTFNAEAAALAHDRTKAFLAAWLKI
jgi:carboxymethylenebutenolidase